MCLERTDPIAWLQNYTGWVPFWYETEILSNHTLLIRIIKKSRQIGITTTISKEATWKAATTSNRLILIVSPSFRQSQQPMSMIHATVDTTPKLYDHITNKSRSEIAFDNGSRILSLPNNPDKLRVFSANDIYLDEAAFFENDAAMMRAIGPMLTATHGTLTIISTPFGKRGMFWEQWQHINVQQAVDPTMKAFDFCPSSISPLIGEEGLERERTSGLYTELEFQQEFLGIFLEEVDVYLPIEMIMSCVNGALVPLVESQPQKRFYWGVDFAKKRDETACIILDKTKRQDGSIKLTTRQWFTWPKMEYSDQIGRFSQLRKHLPCAKGVADQTGVGESVMEDMVRAVPNCEGMIFTDSSKLDILGKLRIWMESTQKKKANPSMVLNELEIPNDKKLLMQLNSITYEVSKSGKILFREEQKAKIHSDLAWALAMAVTAAIGEPEMAVTDLFARPGE